VYVGYCVLLMHLFIVFFLTNKMMIMAMYLFLFVISQVVRK